MLVYNITFHVEDEVQADFLRFLKEEYVPQATQRGFVHSPLLHRVLPHVEEERGHSYAVQFRVKNADTLCFWMEQEGRALSRRLVERYGSKVAGFTTVLEEIDLEK